MKSQVIGFLSIVVAIFLTWIFLELLQKSTGKFPWKSGAKQVLTYNWIMRLVGIVVMLLALGLIAFVFRLSTHPTISLICAVIFGIPSAYLAIETVFTRIEFDDRTIRVASPWRKAREIPWGELVKCDYSMFGSSYLLRTRSNGKIRVSTFLSGSLTLIGEIEKRLQTSA
jgi:hypothetical protein